MATLTAIFQVDFRNLNLIFYKTELETQQKIEDSEDPTNGASDDRYKIWTTNTDEAIAFHGRDFAYGGKVFASTGTVEAFSEWYRDYDTYQITRIYLLDGIDVELSAFFAAIFTENTDDDLALLETIPSGRDTITLSDFDDRAYGFNGADEITGGDGDDVLLGGKGGDTLKGENGDDMLKGENGWGKLLGGDGNDMLRGNEKPIDCAVEQVPTSWSAATATTSSYSRPATRSTSSRIGKPRYCRSRGPRVSHRLDGPDGHPHVPGWQTRGD